jgi:deoxyuridine 5'-triphosphate nucleotidohydrolase
MLHKDAKTPFKTNIDDVGYDVVATERIIEDNYVIYKLGFATEFPKDTEIQIRPRSSISKYDLIMCNSPGTIDPTYRGEWQVRFKIVPSIDTINNAIKSKKPIDISQLKLYEVGDRVAQIVPLKKIQSVNIVHSSILSEEDRGGGFGSTGK